MGDQLKPVLVRQMEVYAGFLAYADHHIGRLIDTLVYLIIGDNGASAEGTRNGTIVHWPRRCRRRSAARTDPGAWGDPGAAARATPRCCSRA